MSKDFRRIYANKEQRAKIMQAFGCTSQHLSNVLYYRRNSDKDKRMRCYAIKLGATEEVVTIRATKLS